MKYYSLQLGQSNYFSISFLLDYIYMNWLMIYLIHTAYNLQGWLSSESLDVSLYCIDTEYLIDD